MVSLRSFSLTTAGLCAVSSSVSSTVHRVVRSVVHGHCGAAAAVGLPDRAEALRLRGCDGPFTSCIRGRRELVTVCLRDRPRGCDAPFTSRLWWRLRCACRLPPGRLPFHRRGCTDPFTSRIRGRRQMLTGRLRESPRIIVSGIIHADTEDVLTGCLQAYPPDRPRGCGAHSSLGFRWPSRIVCRPPPGASRDRRRGRDTSFTLHLRGCQEWSPARLTDNLRERLRIIRERVSSAFIGHRRDVLGLHPRAPFASLRKFETPSAGGLRTTFGTASGPSAPVARRR